MTLRRKPTDTGWSSTRERAEHVSALTRLRGELAAAASPLLSVLSARRQGASDRLLAFGDLLADASATRAGRVITAAVSLTAAWALLGA